MSLFARAHSFLGRVTRPWRRPKPPPPDEPTGPLLDAARSIAFVVNAASDAKGQAWIEAAKARGAEIDMLPLFRPFRREDGRAMSVLLAPPREAYDAVVVNRTIDLFEHSWTYAFLDRLNGFLGENGVIFIPRRKDPARRISNARLRALFGRAPRHETTRFLAFRRAPGGIERPADAAYSALDAYFPIRDDLIASRFEPRLAETIRALSGRRAMPIVRGNVGGELHRLLSQSYRTSSVSLKAAVVQHVVTQCFSGRADLRLVDLGAGTGLNTLELLLNPSGIAHVTLVEPNYEYHWPIAAMVEALGARAAGKVSLDGRRVHNYQGDPADVVTVFSVLAGVAVENRPAFVERAWDSLAPGGILAIQENMKGVGSDGGAPMNKTRCTPDEIDALMSRFAPLRYFASDALKEYTRAEAGDRTVVRVIRKPS